MIVDFDHASLDKTTLHAMIQFLIDVTDGNEHCCPGCMMDISHYDAPYGLETHHGIHPSCWLSHALQGLIELEKQWAP